MDGGPEVVTVLFTDVVGSTNLLTRLGDDAADDLRRSHFALLRRAIADHRGREIKSLGDGLMVAFASARDAVSCAAAMQAAVTAAPDEVGLRVGIDAGEPIHEGDDLFGTPVVVARRLCDAASGGQVLVSDLVRLLVGRRAQHELEPLGPVELKGLDAPVVAHSVRWRATAAPRRAEPETGGAVAGEVRKSITAVSAVLTIATARDDRIDPEALRDVAGRAFAVIERAVERHGGDVQTVTGDAVTAVFGLPSVHEDDALRGVRAAAEAREALSTLAGELGAERALELDFRVGISTGTVVSGGGAERRPRVTGAPLSIASRLGHAAGPGDILLDDATRRLARDALVAEAANDAWRLVNVSDTALRHAERLSSPMIGRARERRRLQDSFEQAVGDRSCQLFTVLGPAGVGKSRLVREFLGDLASEAHVVRGRCLPYGEGITFWPLREAVSQAVGLDATDQPEESAAKLTRALAGEADPEMGARRVAELIGLAEAAGGAEDRFPAVRTLFEALGRTQPFVLVFDDIHWGEVTFLDLVEHIADRARDAPILLVCLARPELLETRPGWGGGKLNATSVLLAPLSDEECGRLIENLVGEAELAEEVASRITGAAEGNPLFVEEMLSMLIDDGLLVRDGERLTATRDLARVPVPPTIHVLLAARLDRLAVEERAMLERGAVEGKVFHEGSVAALAPDPLRDSVGAHLEALVRKDLVGPARSEFPGERAFRFRHLLVRDAAYESIPKATRAQLHELFARWLEGRAGERTPGYDEILGYHLEQAYLYRAELGATDDAARALAREAGERLGAAGQRAFVRGDAPAAVNLIARAVPLLPSDDPSRVELVPNVRVVQGLSGDLGWADRVLTESAATAAADRDRRLEAHALVQRALLRLFTQPDVAAPELFDVARRATSVFDALGDELGLARAWRLAAQAHYLVRRAGPSAEASERALAHARRAGDLLEQREIVEWLCVALMLGPTPAPAAAERCERLLAEVGSDAILEPTVLSVLANVNAMQGRTEKALELLARWRRAVADLGESIWLFAINFGFVALKDDPVAGERELRPWYEALERIGERSHLSSVAGHLALAMCAQGRYDEADRLSHESEEAARPNDIHSHMLWRAARTRVLACKGELEAAESLARAAVAFAADSDFLDSHGDALMNLSEVLRLAGRRREASPVVEQAIRLYDQKGNVVSAAEARAQLNELCAELGT